MYAQGYNLWQKQHFLSLQLRINMKRLTILLAILPCFLLTKAQFVNDYLAAANKYFEKGDYYSAAQYYEKYLDLEKSKKGNKVFNPYEVSAVSNTNKNATANKQQAVYNLAEAYRELHYHEKALPFYEMAASGGDKTVFPLAKFHQGTTLRALGKYAEAETAFNEFKSSYPVTNAYSEAATREMESLRFIQQQLQRQDLNSFTLQKSATYNAEGGTYAPFYMNDGSLWFTSTRPQGDEKGKINNNRIYAASSDGSVQLTNIPQSKEEQQGVATATPDGKRLFLTRWTVLKDKKTASIYSSTNNNGKWDGPTAVAALNAAGSNAQQPFVMPDGKTILFSSDRIGGVGGFDIWKASLDEMGNVGTPVNLGPMLNTASDEQAPSFHAPSNTLVFSSNGRIGMGGFDFYYIKGGIDQMSEPKNFGYPVNSVKDDLYFASKGSANNILENVLMSSDREAACCLELFTLSKVKPLKQITGLVLACDSKQPLSGVRVSITDAGGTVIAEKTTDMSGRYAYSMEEFASLKATGAVSGYFNSSINVALPEDADMVNFNNPDLCLTPVPVTAIKVDNVYYDYNKASLQVNSFESLDQLVTLLNENPSMTIELGAHTDSKGDDAYNQKLSEARAKTVVDYLISKGIDGSRLVAKGYGETAPVAENSNADGTDNPEGRQQNRRTEFKVLKN